MERSLKRAPQTLRYSTTSVCYFILLQQLVGCNTAPQQWLKGKHVIEKAIKTNGEKEKRVHRNHFPVLGEGGDATIGRFIHTDKRYHTATGNRDLLVLCYHSLKVLDMYWSTSGYLHGYVGRYLQYVACVSVATVTVLTGVWIGCCLVPVRERWPAVVGGPLPTLALPR